ncbi:MAG: polysaccharide deacetylase family protein [Victivallaceae bacterium]|nr:polysaccharide deacetylase family protein [Victivallaceae bacterium]
MVKVACCWDDATETDIRLVEMLRKHNAKATFNINLGFHYQNFRRTNTWQPKGGSPAFINRWLSIADLKPLYEGFAIASHGLFHMNFDPSKVDEFVIDQTEDRKRLEDMFQRKIRGMAYPCGVCDELAASRLAEAGFEYGRSTLYVDDFTKNDNPLILKSQCHFLDPQFKEKFAYAKEHGGKFYFWGHSCEMLDVKEKWQLFDSYLDFISADSDATWVDVIDLVTER